MGKYAISLFDNYAYYSENVTHLSVELECFDLCKYDTNNSSLNVFDDGAVLLLFKFWTLSTDRG
jgi:hypothetical protein